MKVMKFGGTSVQDAAHIKKVADLVLAESKKESVAVVLSAMKGITDLLIQSATLAEEGNPAYRESLAQIQIKEKTAVKELFLEKDKTDEVLFKIDELLTELGNILHGVELIRECSPRSLDYIMSFGERLNAFVTAEYMGEKAVFIDARTCVVTDNQFGKAAVLFSETNETIAKLLASEKRIPVITGFVASSKEGITTTLGRNGSDYSASIFGAALDAERVEIWTDVDGVYSADPRTVSSAYIIPELSIEEAMELSYFGAKVIHPYTLLPTVEKNIPIYIKNTMNPSAPGTKIANDVSSNTKAITGLASIEDVSLLNIVGGGMVGIPGIASLIFQALAEADINVIMISQASSEHSICVVCNQKEARKARKALEAKLAPHLKTQRILRVDLLEELEIIAVIGENMSGKPGISGKLFSSLGDAGINIFAIAQGSSERNISFVIYKKHRDKALNTVHEAFLGE